MTKTARSALQRLRRSTRSKAWRRAHAMQLANATLDRDLSRGHLAIIGATGSGKSTLLEILFASIAQHPPGEDEVDVVNHFVFDKQNDFIGPILAMDLPFTVVPT